MTQVHIGRKSLFAMLALSVVFGQVSVTHAIESAFQFERDVRCLSAADYSDRLKGMWVGEMLGNYAGRQVEGYSYFTYEGDVVYATPRPITEYQVPWAAIAQGKYYASNSTTLRDVSNWNGDDDTCFEYMYFAFLNDDSDPTPEEIGAYWKSYVKNNTFYIANRQARYLIERDIYPADSGSIQRNRRWYAIDSQITTEALGALTPGMRQRAADLAGVFGCVSNSGFALHAAQFYAALNAAAPFATDMENLIEQGLEVVPTTSRTCGIISTALNAYRADKAANGTPVDFVGARQVVRDYCQAHGRYIIWVESAMNTGMTVLALLYGDGNFMETVEYGVRGGFDSDCNPATAGGIVGLMKGYDAIVAELQTAGYTVSLPTLYVANGFTASVDSFSSWFENDLSGGLSSNIDDIVQEMLDLTRTQVVLGGGSVVGEGMDEVFNLPSSGTGGDAIATLVEKCDPTGPSGIVDEVLGSGGTVTVSTNVCFNNPANDRHDLNMLIDGIIDVSYNGHLAYSTYDSSVTIPIGEGEDWYQLAFSEPIRFTSFVFHEGDIGALGNRDVADPVNVTGGFFIAGTIVFEVRQDGEWHSVANAVLSEPFEDLVFYQSIEATFDPIVGDAIRIRGVAGGTESFTTAVELEAYGGVIASQTTGDLNCDGIVDVFDIDPFVGALVDSVAYVDDYPNCDPALADCNGDEIVDVFDIDPFVAILVGE